MLSILLVGDHGDHKFHAIASTVARCDTNCWLPIVIVAVNGAGPGWMKKGLNDADCSPCESWAAQRISNYLIIGSGSLGVFGCIGDRNLSDIVCVGLSQGQV